MYRVLTGADDAKFCHRVSEAIGLGYKLHGPPAATFNGESVIVAQALIWPGAEAAMASMKRRRGTASPTPTRIRSQRRKS